MNNYLILIALLCYQFLASRWEDRTPPPGNKIDLGGYQLHYLTAGTNGPWVVLDHSLGGVEGYFLLEELGKVSRVCIYDRAGFGWSSRSPHPRTSKEIVTELDTMLNLAGLEPPYILVGDSFGSYNMRLYAGRFPEKVSGLVLTDGLHEREMLHLPLSLKVLKLFFASGFIISVLGASLGIIRILNIIGVFEVIKPQLRRFRSPALKAVKRSFCRPKHWLTMTEEILRLEESGVQVSRFQNLGNLPIVSIKSRWFFKPSLLMSLFPLKAADQVRDKMHQQLSNLSENFEQLDADKSSHFVWIDQPEVMVKAVKLVLSKLS